MPDPRKKIYDALSSNYDLGSFDDFNKKMDNKESRQKLYNSVSKDFDLGSYNDFETKIAPVKKKVQSTSTSQNTKSDSEALRGSSVGVEKEQNNTTSFQPNPTFGYQDPFKKSKKQENSPSLNKEFDEGTVSWKLKKLKEKNMLHASAWNDVQEAKKVSDEKVQQLKQEVEDEANNDGFWNNIKTSAKKGWNVVVDWASDATDEPGLKELKADTDLLADEKNQAKKEFEQQRLQARKEKKEAPKFSQDDLLNRAKEIKLEKKIKSVSDSQVRDVMAGIEDGYYNNDNDGHNPENVKKDLITFNNLKIASIGEEQKLNLKQQNVLRNKVDGLAKELTTYSIQIKQMQKKGTPVPNALKEEIKAKYNEYQSSIKQGLSLYDDFVSKNDELGSVQENIDLFKRNYGWLKNFNNNVLASTYDMAAGALSFMDYGLEMQKQVIGENKNQQEKQQGLKSGVSALKEAAQSFREEIAKPIGVDNIETPNDFGRWLSNSVVANQIPIYLSLAAGGSGIAFIGASSTGSKYDDMLQEIANGKKYSNTELLTHSAIYGLAESGSAAIDFMLLKNAGRVLKSATTAEKQLIAKGFWEQTKEIGGSAIKSGVTEALDETATQAVENLIDGKPILDNIKDPASAGFVMGALLPLGAHTIKSGVTSFSNYKESGIKKQSALVEKYKEELKKVDLSDETKAILEEQLSKAESKLDASIKGVIKKVETMPQEDYDKVIRIEKEKYSIKNKAIEVNKSDIDETTRKKVLKSLKEDYNTLENDRISILNKDTENNVTQDTTSETKQEAQPQTEVKETEQKVLTKNEATPTEDIVTNGDVQPRVSELEQSKFNGEKNNQSTEISNATNIRTSEAKNEKIVSNIEENKLNLQNNKTEDGISESISQGVNGKIIESNSRNEEISNELQRRISKAQKNESGSLEQRENSKDSREIDNKEAYNFAKETNTWIKDINTLGDTFTGGNENTNVVNVEEQKVYKSNNLMNTMSLSNFFDKVKIHNEIFPNTKYTFEGFTGFELNNKPYVEPVYSQDFITEAEYASENDIETYMNNLGFDKVDDSRFKNNNLEVWDLKPRNVLKDKEGNIHVIDAEFKRLNKTSNKANTLLDRILDDSEISSALDWLDSLKLDDNDLKSTLPFAPQVWNTFIETVKLSLKAGNSIANAIEEARKLLIEKGNNSSEIEKVISFAKTKFADKLKESKGNFTQKPNKHSVLERIKGAENSEFVSKAIEEIGSNYVSENQEKAHRSTVELVDKIGIAEAHNLIKENKVSGATKTFLYNEILQRMTKEIDAKLQETSTIEEYSKVQEDLLAEFQQVSKEFAQFATDTGRESAAFNFIYNLNEDLKYELSKQVEEYKAKNQGVIEPEILTKFQEASTKIKELSERVKELEKQRDDALLNQAVEQINESLKRGKATQSTSILSKPKRKALINKLEKLKVVNNSARSEIVPVTFAYNTAIDVVIKTIDLTGNVFDALQKGIDSLKESDWYKKLKEEEKSTELEKFRSQLEADLKPEIKYAEDGTFKIPNDLIKYYIASGITDINELSKKILDDVSQNIDGITLRDVRDAITGYGKEVSKTKNELQIEKQKMINLGKLYSKLEDLQNGIVNTKSPTKKRNLTNKEVAVKRQIKQLESDLGIKEQKRLDAAKTRTKNRISELEERISNKDYSKKEISELQEDAELAELRSEKLRLQEIFEKEKYLSEIKNRTTFEKTRDHIIGIWNIPRILKATGEMSWILIQGGTQTVSNPKRALSAFGNMMKAMSSQEKLNKLEDIWKQDPLYKVMAKSKLAITEADHKLEAREEAFLGDYANMIWDSVSLGVEVVSKGKSEKFSQLWKEYNPLRVLERGNTAYLNQMRFERFKDGAAMLEMEGKNPIDNKEEYKKLASAINTLTGRANIGLLETNSKALSVVFFSFRNWMSKINMINPYYYASLGNYDSVQDIFTKKPNAAQKVMITDMVKFVTITASMMALVQAAAGKDDDGNDVMTIERDPRSSDFMKMKFGNLRIDPWGGLQSTSTFLARMITEQTKSTKTNKILQGGKDFGARTRGEIAIDYVSNKFNPTMSIVWGFMNSHEGLVEKDKYGNKLEKPYQGRVNKFGNEFAPFSDAENLTPMYWAGWKEIEKEQPGLIGDLAKALGFLGYNTQVYK